MSDAVDLVLRNAEDTTDWQAAHDLFLEYAQALDVDLSFQGFDAELATLPGEYAAPRGVLVLALVDGDLEGQLARFGEVDDVGGRVVLHGHGHGVIAFADELLVGGDQLGHLGHAGDAAGGPEVDQRDLAAEILGGGGGSVEQNKLVLGGGPLRAAGHQGQRQRCRSQRLGQARKVRTKRVLHMSQNDGLCCTQRWSISPQLIS